jgi:transposase
MTSANGMDRPCSRPHRLSESDGASKDTRSTSNVPDDKRCIRQHHWHRYRQEHLHLIGLDEQGMIVLREKLARGRIGGRLANVPPCLIGIEAGMGTHYVARELISLGHDVRQVPPAYAKPFRQTHKNDFRDAYAIAEAVRRHGTVPLAGRLPLRVSRYRSVRRQCRFRSEIV